MISEQFPMALSRAFKGRSTVEVVLRSSSALPESEEEQETESSSEDRCEVVLRRLTFLVE